MVFVLKVDCDGDVRSKLFAALADVTFEECDLFVKGSYGLEDYVARYVDEEGDLCTLTALTLPDALQGLGPDGGSLALSVTATSVDDDFIIVEPAAANDQPATADQIFKSTAESIATTAQPAAGGEEDDQFDNDFIIIEPEAPDNDHAASAGAPTPVEAPASAPADPEDLPVPVTPSVPEGTAPEGIRKESPPRAKTMEDYEKISIILAAFDTNGDGCLNLDELNKFQRAARGVPFASDVYKSLCTHLEVQPAVGLGMTDLCNFLDTDVVERGLKASIAKLEGRAGQQDGGRHHRNSGVGCSAPTSIRGAMSPLIRQLMRA